MDNKEEESMLPPNSATISSVFEPDPLTALTLAYCCDSVEGCPIEGLQNLFAVGNYELIDREKQEKVLENVLLAQNAVRVFSFQSKFQPLVLVFLKKGWAGAAVLCVTRVATWFERRGWRRAALPPSSAAFVLGGHGSGV